MMKEKLQSGWQDYINNTFRLPVSLISQQLTDS